MSFGIKVAVSLAVLSLTTSGSAQQPTLSDPLLDGLQGHWTATGLIAGERTTHDITADWVIGHQYLRLHEVSQELSKSGKPKYEAVVHIGLNQKTNTFGIVWLDDYGGLNTQSVGAAKKEGNALPFVFTNLDGSYTRTTMTFDPARTAWSWTIDVDDAGKLSRFANLTLSRVR